MRNRRDRIIRSLGFDGEKGDANKMLLKLFIVAAGGYFFTSTLFVVSDADIDTKTHPPQAIRMHYVMHAARQWCAEFEPGLESFLTVELFQTVMEALKRLRQSGTVQTFGYCSQNFLNLAPDALIERDLSKHMQRIRDTEGKGTLDNTGDAAG